jgi:hypothetical protein
MSILGGILIIVAVILFFVARGQKAKSTAMLVTETSTAQLLHDIHERIVSSVGADALTEQVELAGVVECDTPLKAPLSNTNCVAYRYVVTREYEEDVTETDDEGNRTTETQRGSETVQSDDQRVQFWVRDDSGRVRIDPTGAELDLKQTGEDYDKEHDVGYGQRRTTGYQKQEHALAMGTQIYVLGCAVDFQGEPMVTRHPTDRSAKFLISWRSERELTAMAEGGSRNLNIAAGVTGALGVVLLLVGFL